MMRHIGMAGLATLLIGCDASPPPANNQPQTAPSVTPPVVAPPLVSPPPVVSPPAAAPSGNVSTHPEELAVRDDIRKIVTATFSNDLDTVIKYTHPRLI